MTEEVQAAEGPAEPKSGGLHTQHVEGFLKAAGEDLDGALECYGFTIWHSMPPKEAAIMKERLGLQPLEAVDLYNRGTGYAMEGDFEQAVADLRAALKKDPDFAPAGFNLAVCLEKMERIKDARKAYQAYLAILDRAQGRRDLGMLSDAEMEDEVARVQQHLETLGEA